MPSAERTATASLLHLAADLRGPTQIDAELPMPEDDEPFDPLTDPEEVSGERAHEHHDDDLGLRSLLEEPEAFTRALWAWRRTTRH